MHHGWCIIFYGPFVFLVCNAALTNRFYICLKLGLGMDSYNKKKNITSKLQYW